MPFILATTFPAAMPPEPLTIGQWLGVAWFAVPVCLVLAFVIRSGRRAPPSRLARLLPIAAGASLALLASAVVLMATAHRGPWLPCEWPEAPIDRVQFFVSAQDGRLQVGWMEPSERRWARSAFTIRAGFGYLNCNAGTVRGIHVGRMRELVAPVWAIATLSGVLPIVWLHRRLTIHSAQRRGLCEACGYDLRATPERCHECGRVPTAAV